MANKPAAYKTLIVGELLQKTALSIGGNAPHAEVDAPLCRDGRGRPTLRGNSLAGALIATARKLYSEPLPGYITAGTPQEQNSKNPLRLDESIWRVFTSHCLPRDGEGEFAYPEAELRSGVGILQRTGAAAENVLFDIETLPAGTRWWFCLEIDDYREPGLTGDARTIAVQSLEQWRLGYCWLGRDVARGLGWMKLVEPRLIRLNADDVDRWPNAAQPPWRVIDDLGDRVDTSEWDRLKTSTVRKLEPQHRLLGRGVISVGLDDWNEDSYGLDLLSVGSSEAMRDHQIWDKTRYIEPEGLDEAGASADFDPDNVLAWTAPYCPNGTRQPSKPYLPGSSLRGPMRHMLSWWLRSHDRDHQVWDPNDPDADPPDIVTDAVAALFGTTNDSAALLISDAQIIDDDYQLALLERHAEDEFTAGAYESSKFNRLCLVKARFAFEFLIEAGSSEQFDQFRTLVDLIGKLGEQRFLPLGGAKWRGNGWVRWQLDFDRGANKNEPAGNHTEERATTE